MKKNLQSVCNHPMTKAVMDKITYRGTYWLDPKKQSHELELHIRNHLELSSGVRRPTGYTDQHWEDHLSRIRGIRDESTCLLNKFFGCQR